ncbi:MAG: phosphoribosyltransferase [Geodermatophilaceae bacterium]|jgi:putative phosphoribosyl transferase
MRFANRTDAGRRLAAALQHLSGDDVIVCGLPRGGVPVAYEVASAIAAPLDVIVVRKLGFPGQPELAMGAVGEGGARFIHAATVRLAGLTTEQLAEIEGRASAEVAHRARAFRNGRDRIEREGRTVVIVDDGLATGSTARAACQVARFEGAARVVLAVPVAPSGWTTWMKAAADEYVCVESPLRMLAVGNWYQDFSATKDEEVVSCLARGQVWRR